MNKCKISDHLKKVNSTFKIVLKHIGGLCSVGGIVAAKQCFATIFKRRGARGRQTIRAKLALCQNGSTPKRHRPRLSPNTSSAGSDSSHFPPLLTALLVA